MKSLFETEPHQEIIARIGALQVDSKPTWGKMNVAQTMRHCQFPLDLALGNFEFPKPNPIMKLLYKSFKKSLCDDKPWKQGMPTAKPFKVEDERDFTKEREQLLTLVNDFHKEKTKTVWDPHPAFGTFTPEQWGKLQYKHLDHHLRQFGI